VVKTLKLESRQKAVWLDATSPAAGATGPAHGATPEHMALINALPQVLVPLTADQVYVRGMYIANDQVWKDGRRIFHPSALAEIVALMRGIPVQINHDTFGATGLPVGRWFDAALIVKPDGSQWIRALFFLPADDANAQLIARIDAGAVSEGSLQIEFSTYECSICGEPVGDCPHMPGDEYDGVTALAVVKDVTSVWEASLVWSGMLEGTSMFIAASRHSAAIPAEEMEARAAAKRRAIEDPWARFWASTSQGAWDDYMKEVGGAPAP
jgi:hypothetical protein